MLRCCMQAANVLLTKAGKVKLTDFGMGLLPLAICWRMLHLESPFRRP